ncbi:hypothetical protein C8Q76DRAFT_577681, partial [Earliella scabrosa]
RKTFYTFPLGPQLQNQWSSVENARLMRHRRDLTRKIREGSVPLDRISDLFYGSEYLDAHDIKDDDMVVLLSIDGAQLYANKSSDCWFLIWVIFDLSP